MPSPVSRLTGMCGGGEVAGHVAGLRRHPDVVQLHGFGAQHQASGAGLQHLKRQGLIDKIPGVGV